MSSRVGDRLSSARKRRFVGRDEELALFQSALSAPALPFCVLFIHGPGGVGKTTLLAQFAACCGTLEIPSVTLDARAVEPQPEAFLGALQRAMGSDEPPLRGLGQIAHRYVITIDTYELLTPLDTWLREEFLPQLSDQVLVVLASRQPPAHAWRMDPGWQDLVRPLPLRNLRPDEGRAYLSLRAIPNDQHATVLGFTHGHPLALSLVAEVFAQRDGFVFRAEETPDVVKVLLEQLVQKVPGPAHRAALETAALVRLTTESLLSEVLGIDDAHELFEWLRGLSFIEAGPLGLFPHDLVRDALGVDVRWRNPEWYAELHRRARHYYASRLSQTRGVEQQRVLFDYVYLHRDNPLMRPYLEWQETGTTMPDSLRVGDREALRALVMANEGPGAAGWFDFWAERQPEGVVVYRDSEAQPSGLFVSLALDQLDPADRDRDPATARAWAFLERSAALRPGERATYFRFWMARDGYQSVSAIQSLIFGRAAQHYLTTPALAFSFFSVAQPDFWAPMFTHVDLPLQPEIAFRTDDRDFGVFVHDWRVTPPMTWLDVLAEREMQMEVQAPPAPAVPLVVLSRPDFEQAVRDALRSLTQLTALEVNPLLRSRLIVDQVGNSATISERVTALRQTLRSAVASLGTTPRQAKLQRALHHTYVQPAPTQDQAAELLDLPFSTYRRHLTSGVTAVTEHLWQREVRGAIQEPKVAAPLTYGG
ncbi:MAG: AAA family ATPase [Nitrolancea sp.]